jgi:hypothetical protein
MDMYDLKQLTQDARILIGAADGYESYADSLRDAGKLDAPEYWQSRAMAAVHFLSAAYVYCGIAWEASNLAEQCDLGWAPRLHAIAKNALECAEEARTLGTQASPPAQSIRSCAERGADIDAEADLAERNADHPTFAPREQMEPFRSCHASEFRQGNSATTIESMTEVALNLSGFLNRFITSPPPHAPSVRLPSRSNREPQTLELGSLETSPAKRSRLSATTRDASAPLRITPPVPDIRSPLHSPSASR